MAAGMDRNVLVEVRGCRQSYHKESSADLVVLDDVNLTLREGEIGFGEGSASLIDQLDDAGQLHARAHRTCEAPAG